MENKKVSVIIPAYNCEKTIFECISSVVTQSYSNIEIIIVNDGSLDNTLNISQNFAEIDNRISIISKVNAGPSSARNKGLENMSGEYVTFLDSDDTLEKNMIELMVSSIRRTNAELVICRSFIRDVNEGTSIIDTKEFSKEILTRLPDELTFLFESEKLNAPWGKLYLSKLIREKKLNFPADISLQEDLYFNVEYLHHVNKVALVNTPLYHYIVGYSGSLTNRYFVNKFEMLDKVHSRLLELYENGETSKSSRQKIAFIYIKNVFAGFINLFHRNCPLYTSQKIEYIKKIVSTDKYKEMLSISKRNGFRYETLRYILMSRNSIFIYFVARFFSFLKNRLKIKYQEF